MLMHFSNYSKSQKLPEVFRSGWQRTNQNIYEYKQIILSQYGKLLNKEVEAANDPKEHYKDTIYFGNVILSP